MATATLDTPRVRTGRQLNLNGATPRLTFAHLLRAERIALFSLRGTWVTAIIGGLLMVLFTVLMTTVRLLVVDEAARSSMASAAVESTNITGAVLAIVAIVVGASAFTREYSAGALSTLLTVAPRRSSLLAAKTTVLAFALAAWSATVVVLATGASVIAERIMGLDAPLIADPKQLFIPLGVVIITVLTGILSLSVATLVRSERWPVPLMIVFVIVLPVVLLSIPVAWITALSDYHFSLSQEVFTTPGDDLGTNLRDIAVTLAWPAVAYVAALIGFVRRDA